MLGILLLLLALADPPPPPLPPPPLVPIYDLTGHALDRFRTGWDRALRKKGQLRVLFWGASHTAADLWTGELRRRWSTLLGEGGHGFVFPVKWNLGYRAQDLVLESSKGWQVTRIKAEGATEVLPLGIAGLVAHSSDPAEFATVRCTAENTLGRSFDKLEVWLEAQPDGGEMRLDIDGHAHMLPTKGPRGNPIVRTFTLADIPHEIRLQPAGNGNVGLYGVVVQRTQPGVVLDQLGIPGMRAEVQLHWREDVFSVLTARRRPDLVVLAYGTNDVGDEGEPIHKYLENWRKVLMQVRTAAPDASCLIVGPTDRLMKEEKRTMPRTPEVIAAQRKVAAEFRCGHWDPQAAMGGPSGPGLPGGMTLWNQLGLSAGDGVHLNRAGYERMAAMMDDALRAAMVAEKVGKGVEKGGKKKR